jgi:hypothetical protein
MKTRAGIMAACMLVGVGTSVWAQNTGGSTTNSTTNSSSGTVTSGTTNNIAQWIEQIKEKRDTEFKARVAGFQKKHDEMVAKRNERMAKNKRLTDVEKQDIINSFDQQYKENMDFLTAQHEKAMKFLDSLAAQTNLTKDQVKEQLKAFVEQQKAENEAHRAKQKAERQAEWAKVKSEIKQNNQASTNQASSASGI